MHLTPRELEKLTILMLAGVALRRKAKGLKLNHPESVTVRFRSGRISISWR